MTISKEKFVLNKVNKQQLLLRLTEYVDCHGIKSVQSYANADILIATIAVESSRSRNVVAIGKDTDLLILLIHDYTHRGENSLYFMSAGESNVSSKKVYDIVCMENSLLSAITEYILPVHVFLGYDTVSRVYSIGKCKKPLINISVSEKIQARLQEFNKEDAEQTSIARNVEELLSQIYESLLTIIKLVAVLHIS